MWYVLGQMYRFLISVIIFTIFLTYGLLSFAQSADSAAKTSPPAEGQGILVPPVISSYFEASYPKEALEAGLEGEVEAELKIDETGLVVEVNIITPAGHGFDEAAEDALYQFVFSPATRDGVPIPSSVIYKYKFLLPSTKEAPAQEEETDADSSLPASLLCTVTDMDGAFLSGVTVMITVEGSEESLTLTTNQDGKLEITDLYPQKYRLEFVLAGYKALSIEEDLEPGEIREVLYRLEAEESMYESVIRSRKPPREVTRREITRREITRIPGTGGDALRSVQNLPGMARAPFISGALIVRGSSPGDSKYLFDGMPIPMLYHFGGLTSIINSDLLESIDFFPGNFSVKYGGATGGVVEVYPRAPNKDRLHAYIDADIWDAGVLLEGPVGRKWSVAASARRSYIDTILNGLMPDNDGFSFTVAPRYYDYQLIADYHPSKKNNLRLFFFGSDDKLVFVMGKDVVGTPVLSGGAKMRMLFHQAQVRWMHDFGGGITNILSIATGFQRTDMGMGSMFTGKADAVPVFLRNELAYDENRNIAFRIGLDSDLWWSKWKVRAPSSGGGLEGQPMDPLTANTEIFETSGKTVTVRPAVYSELEIRPVEKWKLIGGFRLDYFPLVEKIGLDPRFVTKYKLFKKTELKAGIGMFHQSPGDIQSDKDFGNPDLALINAVHYTVGVDQDLYKELTLGIEGFFKRMRNLISSDPETIYNNEGSGKVWGLEFLLKHADNGRFFGWISYTIMRSERIDHPGDKKRLFDFDQTHILTVLANLVLGRGWEAGFRFRLVSGNPDTPVLGSVFDADSDIYWPIYGDSNSTRLPAFHQLDIRVDKKWTFKRNIKMNVYLDVSNLYNRKNPEGYSYNYDYTEKQYFNGLPVMPSIGLKLEY